jgi:hypothetical protein
MHFRLAIMHTQAALCVVVLCHPDEASNASGWKDLGQLRSREAGSGFEIAQRSFADDEWRALRTTRGT